VSEPVQPLAPEFLVEILVLPLLSFALAAVPLDSASPEATEATDALPGDVDAPGENDGADDQPVTGGSPASPGAWPDVAAIYFGREVGCTGVLVAPDVVLTAGHCAEGITAVKLDTVDFEQGGERIAARKVVAYPKWARTYDLALVFLEHASTVEPRVIAQSCALDEWLDVGASVAVVGYGATDKRGEVYGTRLNEGYTEVQDPDCTDLDRGCNERVSPAGELGAGGGGVDACFGDSGGPLYLVTDDGAYLVGITSRGYGDARLPCSEGGIYTRPDAAIDWIEDQIGHELPAPACDDLGQADGSGGVEGAITSMSYEVGVCGLPVEAGWVPALAGALVGLRRRALRPPR